MPKNVHLLRNNPGHKSAFDLTDSVNPEIEIPDCPKHLLPQARKFWKRITPELETLGLVSKIDQAALALACQEWGWVVWHETLLQRDIALANEKEAAWLAKPENAGQAWSGGDGFMLPTPNGSYSYNPHWVARNRHVLLLDKFLASFGMSPSSRGRVTPSTKQLTLPGMAPAEGFNAL